MDTQLVTPVITRPMLELDLIADFVCPWSFLGKRSLERALESLYGLPVRALRWHGFTGQDGARAPGSAQKRWHAYLASRLPSGVSVEAAERNLTEAGEALGIVFDFAHLEQVPDTHEAHRLVALAAREERHSEVAEALFRAFFEQARDIGSREVVTAVGRESGLAPDTLAAFANPEEGRGEILSEERRLRGFGVVATPNLLINGRVLVPGPADVSTYVQALDQALFPQLAAPANRKQLH